jgi:hypothetical protein
MCSCFLYGQSWTLLVSTSSPPKWANLNGKIFLKSACRSWETEPRSQKPSSFLSSVKPLWAHLQVVKDKHNINGYQNSYSWGNPHTTMNIGHYLISNQNWSWCCCIISSKRKNKWCACTRSTLSIYPLRTGNVVHLSTSQWALCCEGMYM